MRILHVYKDFDPPVHGGMERHMALMCRFQRDWASVEALTCSRTWHTGVVERDGTRVTEVGEWFRLQGAPAAPLFPWYLHRAAADVVVVHVPMPTAEVGWLLARSKARLVVRYQSDVVRQAMAMRVYAPVQMRFLRRADVILVASPQYAATSPVLQTLVDKVRVVPLGILPETFSRPDPAEVERLRREYGDPFVLFSGRHRYYKGIEVLVRAAQSIRAPVVIAGDGPERVRCESLARALGVRVFFPGPLSHEGLVNHLHGCRVFAFPSVARSEAFGISMLEAHACGKPVVATKLGTGVEYVNVDGETGLNVTPGDPAALAEAINHLLDDPDLCRQMGARACERVDQEFRADHVARREYELYEAVLARAAGRGVGL